MAIKIISGNYALHQIILIRACVAIVFTLIVLVPIDGGYKYLISKRFGLHILRGFGIVIANICFFTSLITIPLAEAVAIFFIAPLIITTLSVFLLNESVASQTWIAIIFGLLGVIIMFRPGFSIFNPAFILPLIASIAYSLVQILTRKMGESEKASTMVFYVQLNLIFFSGLSGFFFGDGNLADESQPTLFFIFRTWTLPSLEDMIILLGIGVFSGFGTYFVSQAYRISKVGTIAPFEYIAIPLSIFWSINVFGYRPDFMSWMGILLITLSGLYVVYNKVGESNKKDIFKPIP